MVLKYPVHYMSVSREGLEADERIAVILRRELDKEMNQIFTPPVGESENYLVSGRLDSLHNALDVQDELLQRLDSKLSPVCVFDNETVSMDKVPTAPTPRMSDIARIIDDAAAKVDNGNRRIRALLEALTV